MSLPIIRKGYIDTGSGQIHYRYTNSASSTHPKLPVVFLHKAASSSSSFIPLMTHYASLGHACFAPDMPGFGGSFDPVPRDETYDFSWFCQIETETLQALKLLEPGSGGFHIIGHHSGAASAMQLAVIHPRFVKSVTMVGPTILSAEERLKMRTLMSTPYNVPVSDGSHLAKTWQVLAVVGGDKLPLEVLQQEFLDHSRAWEGAFRIYGAIWDFDGIESLKKVTCPVLALCAEKDVLWKYFWRVKDIRPDLRTGKVGGANYSVEGDAEGCCKLIDDFYASLQ